MGEAASAGDYAEEDAVIRRMERMVGYIPLGTRDLLRCLTHPDVWPLMRAYGDAKEPSPASPSPVPHSPEEGQ